MTKKILIVEDDPCQAQSLGTYLEARGWRTWLCGSAEDALSIVADIAPEAVVIDQTLPGGFGTELATAIARRAPSIKIIMLTGDESAKTAVAAFKAGAADYLVKPALPADILARLEQLIDASPAPVGRDRTEKNVPRQALAEILGESEATRGLRAMLQQLIAAEQRIEASQLPAVLVQGETGTGKELVARAIHYAGARHQAPFIEVNCAAIPSQLLEAELFGHERGAFTDAKERKVGLVEAADGGTLFLDEVGEIDLSVQAKLLKLLEEKTIRRLGSVREQVINLRIVSATNRDLEQMVREGRFRADLFFRLRIIRVAVPPLRERDGDILLLARHFLSEHGKRYGRPGLRFSEAAERILMTYSWPGNVREMRNMLEQTVLLSPDQVIQPEQITICRHLSGPSGGGAPERSWTPLANPPPRAGMPTRAQGRTTGGDRETLIDMLSRTDWNVTKTARLLGMSRDMLRYRMDKMGLCREYE